MTTSTSAATITSRKIQRPEGRVSPAIRPITASARLDDEPDHGDRRVSSAVGDDRRSRRERDPGDRERGAGTEAVGESSDAGPPVLLQVGHHVGEVRPGAEQRPGEDHPAGRPDRLLPGEGDEGGQKGEADRVRKERERGVLEPRVVPPGQAEHQDVHQGDLDAERHGEGDGDDRAGDGGAPNGLA